VNGDNRGIVLFGDVVSSRQGFAASTAWLERLRAMLDDAYGPERLAPFEYTQGDEIQGLLALEADPFRAVLDATLRPHRGADAAPRMRWAVVAGEIDPGSGPATRRTGPAFLVARDALERAKHDRDGLVCRTGDRRVDALLDGTAPVLAAMIDAMTDRQRDVARLALVEGLRQSEIAERLNVARATVSVSFARGNVRNLARLLAAVRLLWREGIDRPEARPA
jgi:DNA-binding CsgD family transcriptional regulator